VSAAGESAAAFGVGRGVIELVVVVEGRLVCSRELVPVQFDVGGALHLSEHGRQDEQQRKDREEPVIGDRRSQVATLIVAVLLQHREWEAKPATALLEAVEGAVSVPESAHLSRAPARQSGATSVQPFTICPMSGVYPLGRVCEG
jgi:hypothetical protein